ncbi:MAG: molybdate ABC transporter permease subunit [Anaerolineales bacterium]|nr:molybdate ABC transporter permease subunit [Anaerolineales bacterium]MCB8954707.1 molybdate ABC transporter permease subunit [Ardenticatenales bacterium]
MSARHSPSPPPQPPRFGWTLSLPLLIFLALPLLALIWRSSPQQVALNLGRVAVQQAIFISLITSTVSTGLVILTGTPVAYLMARRQFRGRRAVDTLIDLPTVLPPAVAGVALLMAFGRRGIAGTFLNTLGLNIAFTPIAVVMAQMFIAAPLYIKSAIVGFSGVEPEMEQAAGLDGASNWRVFWHITVPLSRAALLNGAVLTWARALGEFGATIIFAGNFPGRTQTMPLAIYIGFELELNVALTLSVILLGLSFLVLILARLFWQREAA